jgi:hypothetical protein
MKIGIALNDVLRDFLGQLAYTYNKYRVEFDIEKTPVESFDLLESFSDFEDIDELNRFIYQEAALEIFGHADQVEPNIITRFNRFLLDIDDEEEHQVELVSREAINSTPSTFFFLSKTLCKAKNLRFETKYENVWGDLDVLITANPRTLKAKPDGVISVKINTTYNTDVEADFSFDSITSFLTDEDVRNKILNTKQTTYEEVSES